MKRNTHFGSPMHPESVNHWCTVSMVGENLRSRTAHREGAWIVFEEWCPRCDGGWS